MSATCPSCGIAVSCAAHEAELATAIQRIDELERELGIVQLERAEKTRMWDAARKEVERLAGKLTNTARKRGGCF